MASSRLLVPGLRFTSVVTIAGFVASQHDPALFVHISSRGCAHILLYVDNMLITGDDLDYIAFVKAHLPEQFHMSDLGSLTYFLGLSLVYLGITRPDISYDVHILSQFMSAPMSIHYSYLLRVLRYLRVFSLISWKTKKQTIVSRSNAELRALASVTAEVTWLRWLLADFGVALSSSRAVHCDSTGAISIAQDLVKHQLTKHIGIDCFYIPSAVQEVVSLRYVPSELQLADLLTKAHTCAQHGFLLSKLSL
ncbi:hypothetical protein U9M48_035573 [Paspalum notatum var. saurae]|uniref:Reverse transcriptase Ty1/copia-type domain-containing protein n=1 Tax=Paspalum notatum var. saurae TaxID=547442 RepID=A0AAQ3X7V3_PASNO